MINIAHLNVCEVRYLMKKSTRNIIIIVAAVIAAIGIVLAIVLPITLRNTNKLYTVTFDSNGGTAVESITNVERNSTISEPAAPTKDGYEFAGWFADAKLSKKWTFATDKVKGDITLYAKWDYNATNDLEMILNQTSNTYTVAGMGNATDVSDLVIPSTHKELPVAAIAVGAFENVKSITSVFIPQSVTSVKDNAFRNCENLVSATFAGESALGERLFENCQKLERVTLPDNLTEIKPMTFYLCAKLVDVELPSSVTVIGQEAFYGCAKLPTVTLPSQLITLGDKAFAGCESITAVNLPVSVRSLGENVFAGCVRIDTLSVDAHNTYFYSEGNCIVSVTADENGQAVHTVVVGCKSSRIPTSRVTAIGDGAFYACRALTSITIPSNITSIGDHAFASCAGLTAIAIPASVVSIGVGAFTGCEYLETVIFGSNEIPSKLQSIGQEAFSHCNMLNGFVIPASVTFIGAGAFYTYQLRGITISYQGTTEQFDLITIGTVGAGEDNPYTKSIIIRCVASNANTTPIYGLA